MADIILHHYPLSPFAEKIRRILAYKDLPWRSVEQPVMMPKPDLIPLTGGYRRIPVLQIGADIYCDTTCIVRRLERLAPRPACLPARQAGIAAVIEDWADHRLFFQTVPPVIVELEPHLPPDILVDRAAMSPALSRDAIFGAAPHAHAQALLSLDRLDAQLRTDPFLLGDAFSVADAACYHPIWFMQHGGHVFDAVKARPALAAWYARIEAFGPGRVEAMTPAEALAVARAATPEDAGSGEAGSAADYAVGDTVAITPDDYGVEQVKGTVARLSADEIVLTREDASLGMVAVHFPRAGYRVARA
jgi:glutathione S-transferase